jgi:hypothetical protein
MRQALEMALEALERSVATCFDQRSHDAVMGRPEHFVNQAITAIKEALAQPEQEPVAWIHTKIEGVIVPHRPSDLDKYPDRWEALYKVPPPCSTCEALARTVMMDQTGRGA